MATEIDQIRKKTAALILEVIKKRVSAERVLTENRELLRCSDPSVGRALHALGHYASDADIHLKDNDYKKLQEEALKAMADYLGQGLPIPDDQGYW